MREGGLWSICLTFYFPGLVSWVGINLQSVDSKDGLVSVTRVYSSLLVSRGISKLITIGSSPRARHLRDRNRMLYKERLLDSLISSLSVIWLVVSSCAWQSLETTDQGIISLAMTSWFSKCQALVLNRVASDIALHRAPSCFLELVTLLALVSSVTKLRELGIERGESFLE